MIRFFRLILLGLILLSACGPADNNTKKISMTVYKSPT